MLRLRRQRGIGGIWVLPRVLHSRFSGPRRRFKPLARELAVAGVDLFFAPATPMATAAWYAAPKTPIVIATFGYSNKWTNRDARQQVTSTADLSELASDTQRVTTDNRIIVNGLLGLGLEFGDHKIRFTNLFIRDTIKQGPLATTEEANTTGYTRMNQDTAWFERRLFETQTVGEFKFGNIALDVRGTFAKSQREAPPPAC